MKIPCSAASLLAFFSAPTPHCTEGQDDGHDDSTLAVPLLGQVQGFKVHGVRSGHREGIQFDRNAAGRALESWICHCCCHLKAATG